MNEIKVLRSESLTAVMSIPKYAPHMQPQQVACRPNELNRLSFVHAQPSAGFNVRVPWGTSVRFPWSPSSRFPNNGKIGIVPSNGHHPIPMEQYQGNGIPYNGGSTNLNNLHTEVKELHQQLVQALEQ